MSDVTFQLVVEHSVDLTSSNSTATISTFLSDFLETAPKDTLETSIKFQLEKLLESFSTSSGGDADSDIEMQEETEEA
eukprot:m.22329 g.22329  ORF g.22329 m.22329 type:complete len:78 (-) comp13775_c0_seq1:581-814(-)